MSALRNALLVALVLCAGCLHERAYYAKEYETQYLPRCSIVLEPYAGLTSESPIHGALTRSEIRAAALEHVAEINNCYGRALLPWPELKGKTQVQLVIESDGSVSSADVIAPGEMLGLAATTCCIANAARGWMFPQPKGGGKVLVLLPFKLVQTAHRAQWWLAGNEMFP